MKISILVNDLSSNCVVRTYPLAKVLERHYDVEILGPVFGDGVFKPYRDEFEYKTVRGCEYPDYQSREEKLLQKVTGDMVYAFKPLPTSFGLARKWKQRTGKPVVLDAEDWETGAHQTVHPLLFWPYHIKTSWKERRNPKGGFLHVLREEKAAKEADAVTVVSERLRALFGGMKVPHGADTSVFDPARYDGPAMRDELGIREHEHMVLFSGTPRKHKGLHVITDALARAPDLPVRFVFVGGDASDPDFQAARNADPRIVSLGYQPHARMPEFLAAADSVVLPQLRSPWAEAQVPGKVFEAMAMAKPIIASRISDLPEVLGAPDAPAPAAGAYVTARCGMLVEPGDAAGLVAALRALVQDEGAQKRMGAAARQRAVEHYSWDAMERRLVHVFDQWA